jgi:hypothetical protein
MLSLPTSNAEIERAFNQVNIIKTKKRSNMQTEVLDKVILMRLGIYLFVNKAKWMGVPNFLFILRDVITV